MDGFGDWVVRESIDQADLQRTGRMDLFGSDKQFECAAFAYQTRQTLRASPSRDQSQRGPAVSENRVG